VTGFSIVSSRLSRLSSRHSTRVVLQAERARARRLSMDQDKETFWIALRLSLGLVLAGGGWVHTDAQVPLSPAAVVATREGGMLFIACATGGRVLGFDTGLGTVTRSVSVPHPPSGLVLSEDERWLYVTCAAPESRVCVVDLAQQRVTASYAAGHTAMGPVLSPDGRTLYVCNRFGDSVSVIDLGLGGGERVVKVQREPVAAGVTRDGRYLLVANLLHAGRADADHVAASISVIDTAAAVVVKELTLPNGSGVVKDLRVSPDGRHAVASHILARYPLPTTQLDRGWMNTNAKTVIDLERLEILNTVLLDSMDRGAANPRGMAWSADGGTVVITHAGTHEISVVDFPALLAKLEALPGAAGAGLGESYGTSRTRADVPNDLSFMVGVRQRLKLPEADRGPRSAVMVGSRVYVANYFSDTLAMVDLAVSPVRWTSFCLGPELPLSEVRKGEFYFHDAEICFQGWQSCASCHPGDGRVDALNWDLLNDGIGNPKNNKSLLWSHRTPPAMSIGVRDTAETAVRAGIQHILFTQQPEEVALAMDEYLKALRPVPSPYLAEGRLSPAARRGERAYRRANCHSCHPFGLFTDLQAYAVGTHSPWEKPTDRFDTPTLVELWRTAPYLHDGSAATLREVLTTRNPADEHGTTSNLSPVEIDDLVAFLLSI
jgi:YVTN family beta-propeller protein